ncbi:SprT-like family-domain-containing protein [Whalleya microplaca]|nr:SprT-like family-domain-containing protein [Whalleya microplaca]
MFDGLGSSSEDEFPDIDVIMRRYKNRTQVNQGTHGEGSKENAPATATKPDNTEKSAKLKPASSNATPLRRRKLGQSQPIHGSLLKPWNEVEAGEEENAQSLRSRTSRRRLREGSTEASNSSRESSILFPARARQVSSRTSSLRTELHSSAGGSKKPESLATIMQRASKREEVPKESLKHSERLIDSEEGLDIVKDTLESSGNEASEFISNSESDSEPDGCKSDSELFSTPPTRRSGSPSARLAKPQTTLSQKDPVRKGSRGNASSKSQPGATVTDLTKPGPPQRKDSNQSPSLLNASQGGNLEDAFKKLQIFNEDSDSEEPSAKKPILEPTTPKKTLPPSPLKTPKIPKSPWKPEHKEFWDPEANFGWIDKHSPPKKKTLDLTATGSHQDTKAEIKRKYGTSPEKRDAKKAFDAVKEDLARTFLAELDDRVTDGQLAKLTADTGGLRITWSNSLLTTAGRAHWKCKMVTTTRPLTTNDTSTSTSASTSTTATTTTITQKQHHASIELASKVLANESDLLNTVAHEFCHLAVFVLNGKPKAAHGAEFKAWGRRCGAAFGHRGIVVSTKHSYDIEYKYIWRCAECAGEVKRHTRSVDPLRQRCGACRGVLVQVKPVPRGAAAAAGAAAGDDAAEGSGGKAGVAAGETKKKPKSAYQEFMAKEMKSLTLNNKGMSFKDKMAIVSAKWKEHQQGVKGLTAAVEVLEIKDDDEEGQAEA